MKMKVRRPIRKGMEGPAIVILIEHRIGPVVIKTQHAPVSQASRFHVCRPARPEAVYQSIRSGKLCGA